MGTTARGGPGRLWCDEGLSWLHGVVENNTLLASIWIENLECSRATRHGRNNVPLIAERIHLNSRRLISLLAVHACRA